MAGKLDLIDERNGELAIAWFDEDGEGAFVGQDHQQGIAELEKKLAKMRVSKESGRREAIEYFVVEIAALRLADSLEGDDVDACRRAAHGFVFWNRKLAKRFLATCKIAMKTAHDTTPMPEWAKTALENGWKAPKGWKP